MYRFRVAAVNDAGASEPGPPSEPVVVDVPGVQVRETRIRGHRPKSSQETKFWPLGRGIIKIASGRGRGNTS